MCDHRGLRVLTDDIFCAAVGRPSDVAEGFFSKCVCGSDRGHIVGGFPCSGEMGVDDG